MPPRKHGLELSQKVTTVWREPNVERREASAPWPGCALPARCSRYDRGFSAFCLPFLAGSESKRFCSPDERSEIRGAAVKAARSFPDIASLIRATGCAASDLDMSGFPRRIYLTKVGVAAGFLAFVRQYSGRQQNSAARERDFITSPRARGEVDARSAAGEGASPRFGAGRIKRRRWR